MKGKAHDDKAAIVDYERTSCGMGGIIPDPITVNRNSGRINKFQDHLRTMQRKDFSYTGYM